MRRARTGLIPLGLVLPGLALAGAVAAAALALAAAVPARVPVSPVTFAVLGGMALRNLLPLPEAVRPGLRVATTAILRLGIVLLGIRLSVTEVARLGATGAPLVVACLLVGLGLTAALRRLFGLPHRLGVLIGVGTSICGVSAILATAPGLDAPDEEVAYAVGVITVFGVVAMLAYPALVPLLVGSDPTAVGLFLGTAIHDTSQVNGAALLYADVHAAPRALDVAVVTKLLRNLAMLAVVPYLTWRYRRRAGAAVAAGPGAGRLFPRFVLGFVALAVVRSLGDAGLGGGGAAFGVLDAARWAALRGAVQQVSGICLVVALAAVGLGVDVRALRRLTLRPFLVGLGGAVAVGAAAWAGVVALSSSGRLG